MTPSRSRTHSSHESGAPNAPHEAGAPEGNDPGGTDAELPVDTGQAPASAPEAAPAADAEAFRDRWLRAEAELQNYRRRSARDVEETRRSAEEAVLLEIIGFLDDLERGLDSAPSSGADTAWVQGIELVAQRMRDVLARAGVTTLDPMGRSFDPREHEALLELESPGAVPGTVTSVIRKGYRRGDRVLRAARVAVARDADATD